MGCSCLEPFRLSSSDNMNLLALSACEDCCYQGSKGKLASCWGALLPCTLPRMQNRSILNLSGNGRQIKKGEQQEEHHGFAAFVPSASRREVFARIGATMPPSTSIAFCLEVGADAWHASWRSPYLQKTKRHLIVGYARLVTH